MVDELQYSAVIDPCNREGERSLLNNVHRSLTESEVSTAIRVDDRSVLSDDTAEATHSQFSVSIEGRASANNALSLYNAEKNLGSSIGGEEEKASRQLKSQMTTSCGVDS